MAYANPDALVDTDWLAARLNAPGLRILDGSWYLPQMGRDGRAEYDDGHIPGAVFFDIDDIADTASPYPHTLPSAETFAARVGGLGIGDGDQVVIYDGDGLFSAGRVWWMLRYFGHRRVALLDGGVAKWWAEGRPLEREQPVPPRRTYTARPRPAMVRDLEAVRANLESRRKQIVDSRPAGRFDGTEPEPRPGVRGGHIPASLNLPIAGLIDAERRTMLPPARLRRAFEAAGVDLSRPVTTTCGSGVTAAGLALALHLLGHQETALYDGSWSEWGSRDDTPVER